MKKLFAIIGLSLGMAFLTPTKSHAAGGCALYFNGNVSFFQAGGSVSVTLPGGGGYTVDKYNFTDPNANYGIPSGSTIDVFRPFTHDNCGMMIMGWVHLCVCNQTGGIDCAPQGGVIKLSSGILYETFQSYVDCQCPYGTSSGGVILTTQVSCSTP